MDNIHVEVSRINWESDYKWYLFAINIFVSLRVKFKIENLWKVYQIADCF